MNWNGAWPNGPSACSQRERELQSLADNTPDILTRFDRELRYVFVNSAIEKATGRRAGHVPRSVDA